MGYLATTGAYLIIALAISFIVLPLQIQITGQPLPRPHVRWPTPTAGYIRRRCRPHP